LLAARAREGLRRVGSRLSLPQPAQALSSFDCVKPRRGGRDPRGGLVPLPTPCIGQGSSRGPATGPSTITVTTEHRRALRACAMLYGLLALELAKDDAGVDVAEPEARLGDDLEVGQEDRFVRDPVGILGEQWMQIL